MTEQPPSAEAMKIAGSRVHSNENWVILAREIDALIAQRVSAETERCAQIALEYRDEADAGRHPSFGDPDHSMGKGYAANLIAKRMRAPAERPAPPLQPIILPGLTPEQREYFRDLKARHVDYDPYMVIGGPQQQDSLRGIGVEQLTQETDQPGCGEARYCTNLKYRDDFIVSRGLWAEFVASLPPSTLASTGDQPDKEEDFGKDSVLDPSRGAAGNPAVEMLWRGHTESAPRKVLMCWPFSQSYWLDYTERARLFANQTYTGPDAYARYRKALADEFAAVASEHQAEIARLRKELAEVGDEADHLAAQYQALSGIIDSLRVADHANAKAALLARLREPEMVELASRAFADAWNGDPDGWWEGYAGSMRAALAVITEKLT